MSPVNTDAFVVEEQGAIDLARRLIKGRSHAEMLQLAGAFIQQGAQEGILGEDAPRTEDDLWQYIKDTWNVEISRVAVCHDHDAPFDFMWLGYAELVPNLFCIGPRSGGKSYDTALLMELNSRFKPGCESMVFGAVDDQNKKVYEDMVDVFINGGLDKGDSEIVGEPKITETVYKNGSKVRSYPGTYAKMNGQHPPKAHAEEVEIFNAKAWPESRNMATDKVTKEGKRIKAQNFGTSTRKHKNGRVDKIFKKFLKAKEKAIEYLGHGATNDQVRDQICLTSSWYCVIYCTFEISQQVENCRSAPENKGRPEEELCKCNQVINGVWDNGEDRTFESVCKGRLYRSRGHRSYGENLQLFLQNDRGTYEAQQECGEAESEGLYVKSFSKNKHGLSKFPLDPANGPFYSGTDWGTTDAACVEYVQYAERPISAVGYDGNPKIIQRGDRIIFAEVYEEGKTSGELGEAAILKERKLAQMLSVNTLPVRKRWADLQGAGDRKTWKKMGLPTGKYSTRNFDEHVKEMRGLFDAGRVWVVVVQNDLTGMGCPVFCDQIEGWRKDENGNEDRTLPQHAPSAGRYVFYGMHDIYNDPGALRPDGDVASGGSHQVSESAPGAVVHESQFKPDDTPPTEDWRSQFEQPVYPM